MPVPDGLLDCTVSSYELDASGSIGDDLSYAWYNSAGDLLGTTEQYTVSQSDTYTLIITNGTNSCSSTDEVVVTQDADVPTSDAGPDGLLDCSVSSYELDGSGSLGDDLSYAWYNSAGDLLGTTEQYTVTQSDTYTLIITNGTNGCSSTDEVVVAQDTDVPTSNAGPDGLLDCNVSSYELVGKRFHW